MKRTFMDNKSNDYSIADYNKEIDEALEDVTNGRFITKDQMEYANRIKKSVREVEEGKGIIFTIKELKTFLK